MERIKYILKSSKTIYLLYYYVGSTFLKVLGLFIKNDPLLILFNSYGGKKYDDNPKEIYESILKDSRFDKYKLVWAFSNPDNVVIQGRAKKIKTDCITYFVTALSAKVWITNSSMERGLRFKKKNTLYINTWHGSAIKKMGIDIPRDNQSFRSKNKMIADVFLAQSQYDIDVFSHAFQLPREKIKLTGFPRNDVLANHTTKDKEAIKEKLSIEKDKIVLLYAPTFREYSKGKQNEVVYDLPIDLEKWESKLNKKYVVLFRAHYEVAIHTNLEHLSTFRDVSTYPNLNELIIASDALISDYSSIFFDYSVTHKRMFCFAYDLNKYMQERGFYIDLKKVFLGALYFNEDDLLNDILLLGERIKERSKETMYFQKEYAYECGHATQKCCDIIIDTLNKNTNRMLKTPKADNKKDCNCV